nr:hypothetical protein CFP56_61825 [Quercus suber]
MCFLWATSLLGITRDGDYISKHSFKSKIIIWLSDPVENHSNELSVVPFLVAYPFGTPHGFKFFWLEVQLSSLAFGPWGLTSGYCKLGGATFGVAFLSIIFSIKVVWTSLEISLTYLYLQKTQINYNSSSFTIYNSHVYYHDLYNLSLLYQKPKSITIHHPLLYIYNSHVYYHDLYNLSLL